MTIYAVPLLTPDDVRALPGYEHPAKQRRWLERHSIRYAVRKDGTIATTWGMVDAGLSKGATTEPNFEALRHG
jgi:hypothetical protein